MDEAEGLVELPVGGFGERKRVQSSPEGLEGGNLGRVALSGCHQAIRRSLREVVRRRSLGDINARFAQMDLRLRELREDLREVRTLLQEQLRTSGRLNTTSPDRGPVQHESPATAGIGAGARGGAVGGLRAQARSSRALQDSRTRADGGPKEVI